jgi:hypothetical protein
VSTPSTDVRARFPLVAAVFVWLGLVWLSGCEGDAPLLQVPPLTPERDAAVVEPPIPDGAVLCETPEDCNDDVDCTRDLCVARGYCVHAPESSRCSDGVFCNGFERCDRVEGCVASRAPSCEDVSLCTIDSCDEENKRCDHAPRDFDGDGETDWHCAGGTDCDDFDPSRGATALEQCGDGEDDDCDGAIDEDDCGTLQHDTCDDALEVGGGGSFSVPVRGARKDYELGCGDEFGREVTFTFELEEPADVTLRARGVRDDGGQEIATVAVRASCDDVASEVECRRGFPPELRMRALPEGRYFVLAHSPHAGSVVLDVAVDEPSEQPGNEACDDAESLSGLARVESSFVDVNDDEQAGCGFEGAADLVYTFELEETADVELAATSFSGERMSVEVRTECGEPTSAVRCISDAPAQGRLRSLPPGTYFAIVEGPASREVDFSLDIALGEPTDAPEGEGCERAIDLPLGETVEGTLAGRQDMVDVSCGCEGCGLYLRDAVYRLQIEERMDVGLTIEGGEARMHYAVRGACDQPSTQSACGDGLPAFERLRDLAPGEHFIVVEAASTAPFTIETEQLPPTRPIEAIDNGVCAQAVAVPTVGGVFVGDTTSEASDYEASCGGGAFSGDAVFRVELEQPALVRAFLSADFDAVLYRIDDFGEGTCGSIQESACDDDGGGGTNSLLEEQLPAGSYFYVVDGYGFGNQGSYVLDIAIDAP